MLREQANKERDDAIEYDENNKRRELEQQAAESAKKKRYDENRYDWY